MLQQIGKITLGLQIAFKVIKEVHDLVQLVEEDDVDDGEKHGEEKKKAVIDIVDAVYDAGENVMEIPIDKETVMDLADKAVEVFVGLFNAVNRFRSKSE